ncbi:unnamed protein product [Malassezia sympodialis ATCC 42132]|uniref:Uncharacterized protein n=1 Tax=Malassezia sympodialis (strain ATCC 42132) TaxID=1230383 RepID=M5E8L8_MALS4|nr:uncharacterized protein MSY001_1528 [Malassezia sympodialis ATCC 42132]CCU98822.1 unnamed protein product [Malassezia sympodialis ATCC 42132]SHO79099.1 Uncharacterized protein MSYG_3448 [Malassezia sympodialis ATCC 42132]|eukprot:XP_018740103.1 uncharacterized protein MSY001_1528 [Malassezia sympodialis ATCC 42132]
MAVAASWGDAVGERLRRWLRFGSLSLSLAGSQVIWSLELAYGTPYLLSIGLSKEATGYVWLAGPLSGLVMQPVLGSLSDSSTSSFRRRKYMIGCSVVVALATCVVAFSEPLARLLLDVLGVGLGDWDPVRHRHTAAFTQVLSVLGFWVLDFAVNGLQVIARALILDHASASEQNEANAWHGRMLHIGNIVGYWCGWVDLASWPALAWLGGGQFRRFAVLSLVCMGVCVGITCVTTHESNSRCPMPVEESLSRRVARSVHQVYDVGRALPRPILRVCVVQVFATMSWFPFLFYGTTYVLEMAHHATKHQKEDYEKSASFAMLLFALLALVSGSVLPTLSLAGTQDAAPRTHGLTLRTLWTCGALLQGLILLGTFFVHTRAQAMLLLVLMGAPWSVWMWVPYAMIGEFVREAEGQGVSPPPDADEQLPAQRIMERPRSLASDETPRLPHGPSTLDRERHAPSSRTISASYGASIVSRGPDVVKPDDLGTRDHSACGGTVLGIHNLSIVIPQFVVAFAASLIFRLTHGHHGDVAWVLRFGGLMAFVAAAATRLVPLTMTERRSCPHAYTLLPDDEEAEVDADSPEVAPPGLASPG